MLLHAMKTGEFGDIITVVAIALIVIAFCNFRASMHGVSEEQSSRLKTIWPLAVSVMGLLTVVFIIITSTTW